MDAFIPNWVLFYTLIYFFLDYALGWTVYSFFLIVQDMLAVFGVIVVIVMQTQPFYRENIQQFYLKTGPKALTTLNLF